ncbi:MAG: nucleoside-triphosphatase [Oscillospiraceae bacterium]|jgi:nucleoside-triphosphatase|nr:nucleoside-triphosphatase [Oscillospiraceae bacterium]
MNLLLTGVPGVGKSTLINKLLNRLAPQLKRSVGGYYTTRTVTDSGRTFYLNDHRTGEQVRMASWLNSEMDVNFAAFDDFGVRSVKSALELNGIIVLDELGRFEEPCAAFKAAVHSALDSGKLVLGVLKVCETPFIDGIKARSDVTVYTVTEQNRDAAFMELLELAYKS